MNNLPRIAKTNRQVGWTLVDYREGTEQPLQSSEGILCFIRRGHRCENRTFRAKDCCLPAPFCEAASPRKCLKTNKDHILRFVTKLLSEHNVTPRVVPRTVAFPIINESPTNLAISL